MNHRLEIFTIVLDGYPFITQHLPIFNRLQVDWRWTIVHGVSANTRDTRWMNPQLPRFSNDGTTEYLAQVASQHPRVRVLSRKIWDGKTAMCNAALEGACAPSVILQIDVDEIWDVASIELIVALFQDRPEVDRMQFFCRYHFGPNIIAVPRDGRTYGCRGDEWMRAWRMGRSDQRFITHEPPVFGGCRGETISRQETFDLGLEFDHFAYVTQRQLEFKERVYGYNGAVAGWQRLQVNKEWPTRLKTFLPWVDDRVQADLLVR